jgi:hypothetical protein
MKPSIQHVCLFLLTVGLVAPRAFAQDSAAPAGEEQPILWEWDASDPRIGLAPGVEDAGEAISGLVKLSTTPIIDAFKPEDRENGGSFNNTDLAFQGNTVIMGNYRGYNAYDVTNPAAPELIASVVCPGGQGDVSIYGGLLFLSVEETRGRVDCGIEGIQQDVSAERFRGVRIFDVSDIANPRQVAQVQTCRGSHTHTLVTDPNDENFIYVYVSGTGRVRPDQELANCVADYEDPNTSYFRIEVIKVPLANPAGAAIVNEARVFADETGNPAGLWPGGNHGDGTQRTSTTHACHDITAYPAIGLAGGACSGNGIILDISNPARPTRIAEVSDPNFAYWHSATFNNDGSKVLFTDEWGGGRGARCQPTDPPLWGGNVVYSLDADGNMALSGYYKLPAPQTANENCVAHNGSLIPVPGRDIKVQAWYQGGMSIFDFTNPEDIQEIAFFDRGPLSTTDQITGGYWSTYWYNGRIYGSAIVRGLDVFELIPSEQLSANEIEAAKLVQMEEFNPQIQPMLSWPTHPVVAKAYVDQLERAGTLTSRQVSSMRSAIDALASNPTGRRLTRAKSGAEEAASLAESKAGEHHSASLLAEELRALAADL